MDIPLPAPVKSRTTPQRRDLVLTITMVLAIVAIGVLPTGFANQTAPHTMRVRARVIATDNTDVVQFGIVKQGDQLVRLEVLQGPYRGEIVEANNLLIGKMELDKLFEPGDVALTVLTLAEDDQGIVTANAVDHYRIRVELMLFAAFVVALVAFAGWIGVKALTSFVLTAVVIWKLLLPAFLLGFNPLLVSIGLVTLLTAAIVFLIGGVTRKGVVAFLGAAAGVVTTGVLAVVFGALFNIHGAIKPFAETLLYSGYPHLNLRQIFLAGIFIASSGAVMDVAMDISASMHEVKEKHPAITRAELSRSGLAVGRAVIGTMTTTLLLAYSGGFTSLLMVFLAQGTPIMNIANLSYVAAEILHTLVGSFGLVLVAPLTAVIGGAVFSGSGVMSSGRT